MSFSYIFIIGKMYFSKLKPPILLSVSFESQWISHIFILLVGIRWSVYVVKYQRILCVVHILLFFNFLFFTYCEFFTSTLADGFSMEFEGQQFSSSLQDSFQYSVRSKQCCSLDSLHPSRYFPVLWSLHQSFGDCTKSTNYNWYNCHFHVPQLFQFPSLVEVITIIIIIITISLFMNFSHQG